MTDGESAERSNFNTRADLLEAQLADAQRPILQVRMQPFGYRIAFGHPTSVYRCSL
jgi:hypothetical protein